MTDSYKSSPHQLRIEAFMRQAGQAVPSTPVIPSQETLRLRAALIAEEAFELLKALGYSLFCKGVKISFEDLKFHQEFSPNLTKIADGCADLSVVNIGTLSSCGIRDLQLLMEVDNNNLSKFAPGHSFNEHGKLIKPADHKPPNIESVLKEQGYESPLESK